MNKGILVVILGLAALAIPIGAAASPVVFQEDFEDAVWVVGNQVDAAGPLSWVLNNIPAAGTLTIQTTAMSSGGSKSMELWDTASVSGAAGQMIAQMTSSALSGYNGNAGVGQGTIQFDLRNLPGDATMNDNFQIRFFDDAPAPNGTPGADDCLVFIQFMNAKVIRITARAADDSGTQNYCDLAWVIETDYRFLIDFDVATRDLTVTIKDGGPGFANTFYTTGVVKMYNAPGSGFTGVRGIHYVTGNWRLPHYQLDNFSITDTSTSGVQDWKALD